MKLAVAYDPETKEIFQHFGRTPAFKIYEIEDGQILNIETRSTDGQGHGALAGIIADTGAAGLICGGIGPGAVNALLKYRIRAFSGCGGDANEAVLQFLSGTLQYNTDPTCDEHDDEHECGEGNCCQ